MNRPSIRNLLVGLAMVAVALAALLYKPPSAVAQGSKVDLETMIPKQFDGWQMDDPRMTLPSSPEQEEALKKIYSQILTRTYVSSTGTKVMLSVVYGDGIDRQLNIHRPEICYPAQGFSVSRYTDQVINTLFGGLPVRRLVATNGSRIEPISYWIKIGNKTVNNTLERKLEKIKQGLIGGADSGILARVSTIGDDQVLAFKEQEAFINAMLQSIPAEQRKQLIGDQEADLTIAKDIK
ncbi:MAG: EpsI family protein [Gammaproteobacteria bacterium]|nr:EpsI family protein [Gammaproteobacteria bacterium]MBU1481730.1 EpsI family protein [Gammaproteobacteria bacterium]